MENNDRTRATVILNLNEPLPTVDIHTVGSTCATGVTINVFNINNVCRTIKIMDDGSIQIEQIK